MDEHRDKRLKADAVKGSTSEEVHVTAADALPAPTAADASPTALPPASRAPPPKPKPQPQQQKKVLDAPTAINPPAIGEDMAVWENAMMLIDKPKTWTSFDVCGKLKGSLAALLGKKNKQMKVGHAGTLDPMATGLLIVCVGKGTKSINSFMDMHKEYSGIMRLGEGTPSLDADSEINERLPWEHITDEELLSARDKFLGTIDQMPPMFSAIRVGGKRLYESARAGQEVERSSRSITINKYDVWRDETDRQNVHFYVSCSKGTYIRTLAQDLAKAVGSTAHLVALRREAIGEHRVSAAWDINELAEQINKLKDKKRNAAQAGGEAAKVDQEQQA